jgi:hypothetical protein
MDRSRMGVRRRGFTFVELLVAATMMSLLFIGLGAHLRGGLTVWQRVQAVSQPLQQQRAAMELLGRDLAGAVIYDARPNAYGTADGELPMPQLSGSRLSWFTLDGTVRPFGAVRFVEYSCQTIDGREGLWRTSRSIEGARAHEEGSATFLLDGCQSLANRFAYLPPGGSGALDWQAQWQEAYKELPRLIEVRLQLPPRLNQPPREIRRLFLIPTGSLKEFAPPASPP